MLAYNVTQGLPLLEILRKKNDNTFQTLYCSEILSYHQIRMIKQWDDRAELDIIMESGKLYKEVSIILKLKQGYILLNRYFESMLELICNYQTCFLWIKSLNQFEKVQTACIYEIDAC